VAGELSEIAELAAGGLRTLRELGQRIPVGGGVLAGSLHEAVRGRKILITGASSGIGEATALELADAGATVVLVARTRRALRAVAAEAQGRGGTAFVHPCDLSDIEQVQRVAGEILERHGHVDILINNAGKSIRRSVDRSYERFHDYQRTMALNYFAPVRLVLSLLPVMRERGFGHIVNVSTIGLQVNTPRFAAYLASKAALDAFSRSIAPEVIGDGVHVTTVYMPLVRTPMTAPTRMYDRLPALSPQQAAHMICEAIRKRPKRVSTPLGSLGQLTYAIAPGAQDLVVNVAYKLFPEGDEPTDRRTEVEQRAFGRATPGVHW